MPNLNQNEFEYEMERYHTSHLSQSKMETSQTTRTTYPSTKTLVYLGKYAKNITSLSNIMHETTPKNQSENDSPNMYSSIESSEIRQKLKDKK